MTNYFSFLTRLFQSQETQWRVWWFNHNEITAEANLDDLALTFEFVWSDIFERWICREIGNERLDDLAHRVVVTQFWTDVYDKQLWMHEGRPEAVAPI